MRRDSDLDLAARTLSALDPQDRLEIEETLANLVRRDVDLVDLRTASTVLRAQVVTTGRVVLVKSSLDKALFEMRTLKEYAMLNEERRPILERMQREGTLF